jgi:hypothetical protein
MTATTATDASGVEYYFTETSGNPGGDDSGWQDSPTYVDTGFLPGTQYTYTVTARDKSANQNTTAPSVAASPTTGCPADIDEDGDVDQTDLGLMAYDWLESSAAADIYPQPNGDGIVNLKDLAYFAQYWLNGVMP